MTSTGHLKCGRKVFCCCCRLKYFISFNAQKKKSFFFSIVVLPTTDTFWHIYAGTRTVDGQNGRTTHSYPCHRETETLVPTGTCMNLKTIQSVTSMLRTNVSAQSVVLCTSEFVFYFCLAEWRMPLAHKIINCAITMSYY